MSRKKTGGWVRRRKNGNSTITHNTNKGTTHSYSVGGKSNRFTTSILPGGKTKITRTIRNGEWVKRETRTFGGIPKIKTSRILRKRHRKISTKKSTLTWTDFFIIIIILFIVWGL